MMYAKAQISCLFVITLFAFVCDLVLLLPQASIYVMIDVPRTSKYQLIFHYLLARYAPVTAVVKFIPTLDSGKF